MKQFLFLTFALAFLGCGDDGIVRGDMGRPDVIVEGEFRCAERDSRACFRGSWWTCEENGEFLRRVEDNCFDRGEVCLPDVGCAVCAPEQLGCVDNDVVRCDATGSAFNVVEECFIDEGEVCRSGSCINLCQAAIEDKSYQGCQFYSADLDNAAIAIGRDASSQQYAVVVSNPSPLTTEVVVEVNDAPYGQEPILREVDRRLIAPDDLESIRLPRREVDGSSSNRVCTGNETVCPLSEVCVCGGAGTPCFCRVSEEASGLNDGTHSALSSQAYRITSTLPIIAYQFNPLANVSVFSNDASLLLPTSAIGRTYTVVAWPQTIADADCDPFLDPTCSDRDFDPTQDDEDLRSFLTIIGTESNTNVKLTMGPLVGTTVAGGGVPALRAGEVFETTLGPFDVLNIESDGLNTDFSATLIDASAPVSVFVGSEASDAPRFETYATRRCCADHLEEQIFSDETLGSSFSIARMPPRTESLNRAFIDPNQDSVAEVNEPEYLRIVAAAAGETTITTTLPPPEDRIIMNQGESIFLPVLQDFLMSTSDGKPIAVLQTLPSQQAIGIPNYYPGGDPAIMAVPPIEQYRRDYVFLTPDLYAFDYVVITADRNTDVRLDGHSVRNLPNEESEIRCERGDADGIMRMPDDPPADKVVWRCQLSFPSIGLSCDPDNPDCAPDPIDSEEGQNDGVHTVEADNAVGVLVYGFDSFVSYAYAAGLDLKPIPR